MRGIGFTVQTTDPQCASCPAFLQSAMLHTAAGLCACDVCVRAVCLGSGDLEDPCIAKKEVLAEIEVTVHSGRGIETLCKQTLQTLKQCVFLGQRGFVRRINQSGVRTRSHEVILHSTVCLIWF